MTTPATTLVAEGRGRARAIRPAAVLDLERSHSVVEEVLDNFLTGRAGR
ncbi:hypothetical protein [Streptomyces sp. NPDC051662]